VHSVLDTLRTERDATVKPPVRTAEQLAAMDKARAEFMASAPPQQQAQLDAAMSGKHDTLLDALAEHPNPYATGPNADPVLAEKRRDNLRGIAEAKRRREKAEEYDALDERVRRVERTAKAGFGTVLGVMAHMASADAAKVPLRRSWFAPEQQSAYIARLGMTSWRRLPE
jgi:hypothetical protein